MIFRPTLSLTWGGREVLPKFRQVSEGWLGLTQCVMKTARPGTAEVNGCHFWVRKKVLMRRVEKKKIVRKMRFTGLDGRGSVSVSVSVSQCVCLHRYLHRYVYMYMYMCNIYIYIYSTYVYLDDPGTWDWWLVSDPPLSTGFIGYVVCLEASYQASISATRIHPGEDGLVCESPIEWATVSTMHMGLVPGNGL